MSKFTHEQREQFITMFSLLVSGLALVATFALIGLEAYVRWTINKEFSFLGGSTLSALTVSSFALLISLLLTHRTKKD